MRTDNFASRDKGTARSCAFVVTVRGLELRGDVHEYQAGALAHAVVVHLSEEDLRLGSGENLLRVANFRSEERQLGDYDRPVVTDGLDAQFVHRSPCFGVDVVGGAHHGGARPAGAGGRQLVAERALLTGYRGKYDGYIDAENRSRRAATLT